MMNQLLQKTKMCKNEYPIDDQNGGKMAKIDTL